MDGRLPVRNFCGERAEQKPQCLARFPPTLAEHTRLPLNFTLSQNLTSSADRVRFHFTRNHSLTPFQDFRSGGVVADNLFAAGRSFDGTSGPRPAATTVRRARAACICSLFLLGFFFSARAKEFVLPGSSSGWRRSTSGGGCQKASLTISSQEPLRVVFQR